MVMWYFEFEDTWVRELPIHVLEAALLPVQELLFLGTIREFKWVVEFCDNECTVMAASRRRPKDVRLLTTTLFRDSLLELSTNGLKFREVRHIRSKANHLADSLSRGRLEEAQANASLGGDQVTSILTCATTRSGQRCRTCSPNLWAYRRA